jgi:hypothetical protein
VIPGPYAPPKAGLADVEDPRRTRPRSVKIGVVLAWTALGISLLSDGIQISPYGYPSTASLTFALAWIGFWTAVVAIINLKIWQGRNWARIAKLILSILAWMIVFQGFSFFLQRPLELVMMCVATVIEVSGLVLFFGPGRSFFRKVP